jgi:acyl-coenzyme A thioesterase PaaI-like protein
MEYFKLIPWCATILESPGVVIFTPPCRLQDDENGNCPTKDQFFRQILQNRDAIPNCIGFYQRTSSDAMVTYPSAERAQQFLINSSTLMLDLRQGLNGFSGSAHGGLIATLMDEAMGSLIFQNHEAYMEMERRKEALSPNILNMHGLTLLTASMNVRYQKRLATPQVVLATATLSRIEGRKVFVDVVVENGRGVTFGQCEGMRVTVSKEKSIAQNKL